MCENKDEKNSAFGHFSCSDPYNEQGCTFPLRQRKSKRVPSTILDEIFGKK